MVPEGISRERHAPTTSPAIKEKNEGYNNKRKSVLELLKVMSKEDCWKGDDKRAATAIDKSSSVIINSSRKQLAWRPPFTRELIYVKVIIIYAFEGEVFSLILDCMCSF